MQFVVLYLIMCAIVGHVGRDRNIGFWGFFVMALFTSPITAFLWLAISSPRRKDPI